MCFKEISSFLCKLCCVVLQITAGMDVHCMFLKGSVQDLLSVQNSMATRSIQWSDRLGLSLGCK